MKNRMFNKQKIILLGLGSLLWCGTSIAQNGEDLFTQHCKACHTTNSTKLIGPGMAGITEKRSADWLKTWIKDSQAMINSGDADAKAIFDEYSQQTMPAFPQLADGDISAIIDYLGSDIPQDEETVVVVINYTDLEISDGKKYFTGNKRFVNGGPACVTCHNVTDEGVTGGYLAKDLTDVYMRMGEAGINAMVGSAPFPAMNQAYLDNPVTQIEMKSLSGYLKSVSTNTVEDKTSSIMTFLFLGLSGFVIFLLIIMMIWSQRKRDSVKKDIFDRQLNAIN